MNWAVVKPGHVIFTMVNEHEMVNRVDNEV